LSFLALELSARAAFQTVAFVDGIDPRRASRPSALRDVDRSDTTKRGSR